MDSVEEEHWARRAKEWAQQHVVVPENYQLSALLQNVPPAPVWNRGRGRERGRFHMTPAHVPQNLDDTILDLHKCQLAQQMLSREQQ